MLAFILAISLFSSSDTVVVRGTQGISYRVFVSDKNLYFQYSIGRHWKLPTMLDSSNCYSPSIAITPGDFIHIAYEDSNSIYYLTTTTKIDKSFIKTQSKPQWTPKYCVSAYLSYNEPASNSSIVTINNYVYIIWHSHDRMWRRCRDTAQPYYLWYEPEDIGKLK